VHEYALGFLLCIVAESIAMVERKRMMLLAFRFCCSSEGEILVYGDTLRGLATLRSLSQMTMISLDQMVKNGPIVRSQNQTISLRDFATGVLKHFNRWVAWCLNETE
jgi:hypothetical protein